MLKRKTQVTIPAPSKFDRLTESDLINCIEAEIGRSAELFRGLSHSEIDNAWVLSGMSGHLQSALLAVQALQRRVATVQSL
jgi:hypothetical protein